jgi:hypothetical protein
MSFLATSTKLGNLELLEVYVQYNGPRLLACKNQANKVFLALWVDEEEESDLWFYMLVSYEKLIAIRKGEISLHQAFSNPENNYIYELTYTNGNAQWSVEKKSIESISEDCLPLENTFICCNLENLPSLVLQEVIQNAILKTREVVNLVLEPPFSDYPNEFSAFKLGEILSTFQSLVDQLVTPSKPPKIPPLLSIKKQTNFNVFATSPGSFKVKLASSIFSPDMYDNSLAGDAIEKLLDLIKIGKDPDNLQGFMLKSHKKTAVKYRSFLEAVVSSESSLRIEWGSPALTRGSGISVDIQSIKDTIEVIKKIDLLQSREINIIGDLFKVDKDSWKFGIKDISTEISYKGDIRIEAQGDAGSATIGKLYSATIIEIPKINPTTNETKSSYHLITLNLYESPLEQMELEGI